MEIGMWGEGRQYYNFRHSMDNIGWRRSTGGIMWKEVLPIQAKYITLGDRTLSLDNWARYLTVTYFHATHEQWLH